jgi:hypothetical protein
VVNLLFKTEYMPRAVVQFVTTFSIHVYLIVFNYWTRERERCKVFLFSIFLSESLKYQISEYYNLNFFFLSKQVFPQNLVLAYRKRKKIKRKMQQSTVVWIGPTVIGCRVNVCRLVLATLITFFCQVSIKELEFLRIWPLETIDFLERKKLSHANYLKFTKQWFWPQ